MPEIVLVTEKEYRKAEAVFQAETRFQVQCAPPPEAELAAAVRAAGARAVIVGIEPYRGPLYESLAAVAGTRGALIARFGVGHDSIDKPAARQRGILVTNTPGTLDASVAELALWLMGNLLRHVSALESRFRSGKFSAYVGQELRGKTLCVLGFGGIGRQVAAMAHFGFGMRVVAVDSRDPEELARTAQRPLDDLLREWGLAEYHRDFAPAVAQADVVSIHLPATPETRRFIHAQTLARFQPGAVLVNTARGAILDEAALYDALVAGQLAGAALDVFEHEPYQPVAADKDLRTLDNVVLTPHIGSNTIEANSRMASSALENVAHFFAGRNGALSRVD